MHFSHLGLTVPSTSLFGHGDQLLQYKADINAVNEHGNVPLHYACFWGQDQVAEVSTQASSGMGGKSELEWETLEPSTHPVSTVLGTTFTRFVLHLHSWLVGNALIIAIS